MPELNLPKIILSALAVGLLLAVPGALLILWGSIVMFFQVYFLPEKLISNDHYQSLLPKVAQPKGSPDYEIACVLRYYKPWEWRTVIKYLGFGYHFSSYRHDQENLINGGLAVGADRCLQEWRQYEVAYDRLGYRTIGFSTFDDWYKFGGNHPVVRIDLGPKPRTDMLPSDFDADQFFRNSQAR